ncbi:MAG: hypothetical protein ACRDFX_09700 [Chloroflexota bacterium]
MGHGVRLGVTQRLRISVRIVPEAVRSGLATVSANKRGIISYAQSGDQSLAQLDDAVRKAVIGK